MTIIRTILEVGCICGGGVGLFLLGRALIWEYHAERERHIARILKMTTEGEKEAHDQ